MHIVIRILLVLVLLWGGRAAAQVTPNSVVTPQAVTNGLFSFIQGTHAANTLQTIFTPGANGARCNGMLITTNDGTVTHILNLVLENAGVARTLATVTTTLSQGYLTATPGLAPLNTTTIPGLPVDSNNNAYLVLKSGDTLRMRFATALTAATQIDVYTTCVNF